jgi:DNA-binding FrmR family transcriptional regulator
MSCENTKAKVNRLNRIAGQVRGIAQMIEGGRYCIDVLTQIQAVKSALAKVESEVLKDHAATCVADAIASGNETEQRAKFNELIELMERQRR